MVVLPKEGVEVFVTYNELVIPVPETFQPLYCFDEGDNLYFVSFS
jgi:hypothetical protein